MLWAGYLQYRGKTGDTVKLRSSVIFVEICSASQAKHRRGNLRRSAGSAGNHLQVIKESPVPHMRGKISQTGIVVGYIVRILRSSVIFVEICFAPEKNPEIREKGQVLRGYDKIPFLLRRLL